MVLQLSTRCVFMVWYLVKHRIRHYGVILSEAKFTRFWCGT